MNEYMHVQWLLERHFDRLCGNYVVFEVFYI